VSPVNGLIVYQAREPWEPRKREETEFPQVFMAEPDGTNARFITNGMGERWSPDGKWFLVLRPEWRNDISNGQRKHWEVCILSADGQFKLELEGFEKASTYQWSRTSDHIIVGLHSGRGFQVLALKESDKQLGSSEGT
jgi:Tol biopolymer transport system component